MIQDYERRYKKDYSVEVIGYLNPDDFEEDKTNDL